MNSAEEKEIWRNRCLRPGAGHAVALHRIILNAMNHDAHPLLSILARGALETVALINSCFQNGYHVLERSCFKMTVGGCDPKYSSPFTGLLHSR